MSKEDTIGLLVKAGDKVLVSTGVPKETLMKDVRIWRGEVERTEGSRKLSVIIGVDIPMAGFKKETEVDMSVRYEDISAELYKVDCSSGVCEKQVIDTWTPNRGTRK